MLRKVNGKEDLTGAAISIARANADALFYDGLQYSPPARGSWNIVHSAMLVPESHQFYICALGCLRGVVLTAAEMGDMSRFSSIIIEEHHLYDGTMEETIINSITDILQGLPKLPKVAFVYPSCVHHFMGCDFDGIYDTLQQTFPTVQFMPCWMDPIRRQSNLTAEMRTRRQMYRPLKKTTLDRHNDSLCEKVFVSTEKVRTLPLPFIFLLVVIDAVRLPQGDMAVEESVRNEMWLRLVHHPWCITVIYTPPPCWCTTVAQLRSWHKHLYRHTCRVDT